mmetsp:Transcript_62967/g.172902  ORF Transcript_62967/g.172902 Transcript_62967/m.172902 type:complete len:255 (+) Transcript_62967:1923-2687(+)
MTTSSFLTGTRFITSKILRRCWSFKCAKRKLALTALEMRSISWSVLATTPGSYSPSSSSSSIADAAIVSACFFSFESPRRTGRFSPPARDTRSRPSEMLSAEPRRLSLRRRESMPSSLFAVAPSMKARIIVMSSVRTSYWSQRRYDSATTERHASSGSVNLRIMSVTDWLVRNSQTPSDATTTNWSSADRCFTRSSGSAKTPIVSATESPMERVNAQPGNVLPGAHTRGGSPPLSSSSPRLTPQFSWYGTIPSS